MGNRPWLLAAPYKSIRKIKGKIKGKHATSKMVAARIAIPREKTRQLNGVSAE
jgi:hypothetical protein